MVAKDSSRKPTEAGFLHTCRSFRLIPRSSALLLWRVKWSSVFLHSGAVGTTQGEVNNPVNDRFLFAETRRCRSVSPRHTAIFSFIIHCILICFYSLSYGARNSCLRGKHDIRVQCTSPVLGSQRGISQWRRDEIKIAGARRRSKDRSSKSKGLSRGPRVLRERAYRPSTPARVCGSAITFPL